MRLDWLEDILAVVETGSFSDAAARRHLTQSAFSRRMAGIEAQLGVPLFDRSRKPAQLAPPVLVQRDRMARLAQELRNLTADLRQGDRYAGQRIVLASQHALTTALSPGLLQRIEGARPDIFVDLQSANHDACFAALLARQADIALVYRLPGQDHPVSAAFIETLVLGQDRLVPVLAADRVAPVLAAPVLPFIAYPATVFLGQALDRLVLPRLPVAARPRAETALTLAALEMAAAGVAVAWVPRTLAAGRFGREGLADLSDRLPDLALDITAVRLRGAREGAAQAVWGALGGR